MFWQRKRQRDIFTFWDGERERSIDPMPAWFAIDNDPECDPKRDFPAADRGDREAWCRVQAMIRRMFGLKPYEAGGLTEYETNQLMATFIVFTTGLKKKRGDFRMSWGLTVGAQSDESTTPPDAESGSTSNESSSGEPSESSAPSPSPSET